MSRLTVAIRKPAFIVAIMLPVALITELVILEGVHGVSFPSDRGSAVSSYVEGPPNATVTIEAMHGDDVRWTFQEPGERGEPVTGDVYLVTKFSVGETPATYTFSR